MRMTRCLIGLAGALTLAMSAPSFAVQGERVAAVEDYPAHSQAMPTAVAVVSFTLQERMCSQSGDMLADIVPSAFHLVDSADFASVGVTLPVLATRINAHKAKAPV